MTDFRWGAAPQPELPSIAGYTILDRLGAGGMGEVFRAQDQGLGREVALKVTPRSRVTEASAARFQREAQLLARFQHPGVLTVHAWGDTAEWLYLVCELIEGARTFAEACADLSSKQIVTLGREVLEILAALHEAGVVHRDVKPSNVLVTPAGVIKLVDFGIATAEELNRLTLSGGDHLEAARPRTGRLGGCGPRRSRSVHALGPRRTDWTRPEPTRRRSARRRAEEPPGRRRNDPDLRSPHSLRGEPEGRLLLDRANR